MSIKLGVAGSRNGATAAQRIAMQNVIWSFLPISESHHGDCIGVDDLFAEMIEAVIEVVGNPTTRYVYPADVPNNLRAFRTGIIAPTKPPLERNKDLVDACNVLIAVPSGPETYRGSGTWACIRYARSVGRRIVILQPDGKIVRENETI
jgi:hypothetical protein